jgi:hypothetical protein
MGTDQKKKLSRMEGSALVDVTQSNQGKNGFWRGVVRDGQGAGSAPQRPDLLFQGSECLSGIGTVHFGGSCGGDGSA